MTVEERAEKAVALMIDNRDQPLVKLIAEILCDQIEDCARLVDQAGLISLSQLARAIRALAAPNRKGAER